MYEITLRFSVEFRPDPCYDLCMKKCLSILILLLLLAGCARGAAPEEASAPQAEVLPAATAAPVTAAPTAKAEQKISIGASVTATATPPASPAPSPVPTPTPFSLVAIPDTQALAYSKPEVIREVRDWIEAHRDSDNILGILHTGDMVDNGYKEWEWDNLAPLLEAAHDGMFLLPVAGNHDLGTEAKSYYAYLKRPFLNEYPDEQKFEGGKMLYRVLSAGGEDILLLGVGWDSYQSSAAKAWLDKVFSDHADLPCILVTHGFLLSNGSYIAAMEQLVARYGAIHLVICGHSRDYQTRVFSYDDDGNGTTDRDVNVLMLNMQAKADYAFRLLTFDPLTHSVTVRTLTPAGAPASDIPGAGPISFTLENAY